MFIMKGRVLGLIGLKAINKASCSSETLTFPGEWRIVSFSSQRHDPTCVLTACV
jgi:hypothetical protein